MVKKIKAHISPKIHEGDIVATSEDTLGIVYALNADNDALVLQPDRKYNKEPVIFSQDKLTVIKQATEPISTKEEAALILLMIFFGFNTDGQTTTIILIKELMKPENESVNILDAVDFISLEADASTLIEALKQDSHTAFVKKAVDAILFAMDFCGPDIPKKKNDFFQFLKKLPQNDDPTPFIIYESLHKPYLCTITEVIDTEEERAVCIAYKNQKGETKSKSLSMDTMLLKWVLVDVSK